MSSKNKIPLRQRVLQSGSWTLAGHGLSQLLRFGGNLILTRLLFPEAFGMMAIIQIVIYGLHMLSDVGIETSIVQKDKGNNPDFLNTAWTIQIIRGFLIWAVLCILALPIANFYGEPQLASMLIVVGIISVISGFNSTKLCTAQRNLEAGRVTLIELGSSALGLLFTVCLAWLMQSVWALVWGNIITILLKMLASHAALHGIRNKFQWDSDSLHHLRGFGRWIMLNSILTFLSIEGARLLISALLDMRQLALFTLASAMSLMFWQAIQQLSSKVFFPAFSELYRSNQNNLNKILLKSRALLILPSWAVAVFFIFYGSQLMGLLYDNRYHGSGDMLQLLAAGSLLSYVWGSYTSAFWALGKVASMTALTAVQISCQIGAIYFGFRYWGNQGIVFGIAMANWLVYPAYAYVANCNKLWHPKLDMTIFAASVLIVMLAWPNLTITFGS